MKMLLKSEVCESCNWKVAEKVIHTPKPTIKVWKIFFFFWKYRHEPGKRKMRFPNAHLVNDRFKL